MWITVARAREILKLTSEDIDDSTLAKHIESAQRIVRADTGLWVERVPLRDGNKLIVIPPIGDSDFDGKVTPNDVKVYAWFGNTEDTKVEIEVESVYPSSGLIVLKGEIPPEASNITVKYIHSWIEEEPSMLELATALMTGFIYSCNVYFSPPEFRLGSLVMSFRIGGRGGSGTAYPAQLFWSEYQRVIAPYRLKVMEVLKLIPSPLEEREP